MSEQVLFWRYIFTQNAFKRNIFPSKYGCIIIISDKIFSKVLKLLSGEKISQPWKYESEKCISRINILKIKWEVGKALIIE